MAGVATGAPDPENPWPDAADPPPGDVLEGGLRRGWWRRRWGGLSRSARLLLVAVVILLAAGAGGVELRNRAAERAVAERVDLTASIGLSSLSMTPPGGQVSFFLVVRNEGALPVRITSVEGSAHGLRIRMQDDVARQVSPDAEAAVPVSVRLTCARYGDGAELRAEIAVRRADGAAVTRRVRPEPARLLLDVATTVCGSRPDLRDQELSGPVLDSLAAGGPDR
jgi:hypothetical protein